MNAESLIEESGALKAELASNRPLAPEKEAAYRMLDAFTSVGATHFDVTFLDIDGAKRGFRPKQTAQQLRHSIPMLLPGLKQRQQSLVIRPHSKEGVMLVQLDDLKTNALERLKDVAFLTLCTSAGNHQAWLAIAGATDKDIARRLRKGVGADISASGATRVAGTVNYKKKYEPDFPSVSIVTAVPSRIVTPERLHELGLLAAPEPVRATPLRVSTSRDRRWPDYERTMQGAPLNHGQTGPDISRADYFWCLMSAQRGWSVDAIAAKLMELSSKARENGENYARITAENACAAAIRKTHSR